ncbi:MAG: NF038122 family metalloprotease [Methylococcales bacterium]|nr:NF038122 family metalloprotease [Methylococcales bacterium]
MDFLYLPAHKIRLKPILAGLLALASMDAHALTINGIFFSGVTAAEQSAFNYAASQFESMFSNNITVNIDVQPVSGVSYLGAASANLSLFNTSSYNQIATAITAADSQASLPGTISFGSTNYIAMTYAEAEALNLTGNNPYAIAGTFTFNTTYQYSTDPNNQAVAGEYDFIGVAEHEIAHLLGRIPGLDSSLSNGATYLTPLDFFRYTDVLGQPTSSPTAINGAYFSINGGVTNSQTFSSSSDYSDWAGSNPSDPFNAITTSGVNNGAMTTADIQVMQALGYTLVPLPIPAASGLFMAGCLGLMIIAVRRRPFGG